MKKNILITGIAVICIVGISLGFVIIPMLSPPSEGNVHIFDSLTYSWDTTTPQDQNMDSTKLAVISDYIFGEQLNIDSILITRNGFIVAENYYENYLVKEDKNYSSYSNPRVINGTQKHDLQSATKTIVAILIGIAIDKGYIDNVSQTFFEFFPERWNSAYDAKKREITIEHLLRHESGLLGTFSGTQFEPYGDDLLDRSISRPLWSDPGAPFINMWDQYSSEGPTLLNGIIEKTSGYNTTAFAQEFLFGPLGISAENYYWVNYGGIYPGGWGLYMNPIDMAKIGYLFINNGIWNGTQIVSSEYIDAMKVDYPGDPGEIDNRHHGYLTWINAGNPTFWYASGAYGQKIIMIPEYNIVVVITATEETDSESFIIRNFIIPSLLDP